MLQLPAWLTTRPRRLVPARTGAEPEDLATGSARAGGDASDGVADNARRPVIDLVRPHLQGGEALIVTGYQDFLSSLAILMREVPALANPVENQIRPIALTRKNALFVGNETGAENWAMKLRSSTSVGTFFP